jgi:pSer/pThr/pTyr-binding forkhead associated (FHA) protein/NADPH-dependent 2,4-dienoyl-CoA reductase/sulfur reductase-like enzyme
LTRYLIIGDGAAGTTAAQYIRRMDPSGKVRIYSDDPNPGYYRAALTNYLIGELREDHLFCVPPDFYPRFGVDRVLGRAMAVDSANARVIMADGQTVPYDQLLIGAGASPNRPGFPGGDVPGVMTMRTLQDARVVLELLRAGRIKRAVVVGGGPLGLEWVQGLRVRGVQVTYVLRGRGFMDGILDPVGSDLVMSRLKADGVDVKTNEEIGEVIPGKDGRLRAVRLKNSGATVDCQLVGLAIGIRSNIEFLKGSGLTLNRGIPVDDHVRTNLPNVYAAGDIADVFDPAVGLHRSFGLWEPARLQGRTAGINMAGGNDTYRVDVQYNATRLYDLDFAALGETIERPGDRVILDFPRGGGRIVYRKLVVRNGKLVGALLLGLRKEGVRRRGLQFKRLIESGADVSAVADQLLDQGFDLPAWLDSLDPRDVVRQSRMISLAELKAAAEVPSTSRMMQRSRELSRDILQQMQVPEGVRPAATLTVQETSNQVSLKEATRIGRRPDNDLVLFDGLVSGSHAEVRFESGQYVLVDAQSRNGTFLNEVRLTAPATLSDGDVIRVGYTHLIFAQAAPRTTVAPGQSDLPGLDQAPSPLPADAILGSIQLGSRRIDIRGPITSIGRDPESDILVDDPAVSFVHCQITRHGDVLYLRDLGSRNGTYANARLVTVPHELKDGDVIHVGNSDLAFSAAGRAATPPPVAAPQPPVPAAAGPATPPPTEAMPPISAPTPPLPPAPAPPPAPADGPRMAAPGATRMVARPSAPVVRVTVVAGQDVGLDFELTGSQMVAGRDPAEQIVLRDDTVSRRHARFDRKGPAWTVTDLGSTNGSFVGGRRLEPNAETPLADGDRLRLGDVEMEVSVTSGAGG